ncbi:MAG TPA: DUF899 family protein [Candidatus Binatia bacterium]|nr:DUF899 family protein [Candidatus Binatia bacterium]
MTKPAGLPLDVVAYAAPQERCPRSTAQRGEASTPGEIAAGRAFCNYEYVNPGLEDRSGDSVFYKDGAGQIFHTYSTFGRGGEEFLGIYRYLDAPLGRGEDGPCNTLADWVRPRTMYGQGGMVEITGRYHRPQCACAVHESADRKEPS